MRASILFLSLFFHMPPLLFSMFWGLQIFFQLIGFSCLRFLFACYLDFFLGRNYSLLQFSICGLYISVISLFAFISSLDFSSLSCWLVPRFPGIWVSMVGLCLWSVSWYCGQIMFFLLFWTPRLHQLYFFFLQLQVSYWVYYRFLTWFVSVYSGPESTVCFCRCKCQVWVFQ